MRSMTGFGLGTAALHEGTLQVEIRSLNHRYQDVRLRLPPDWAEHGFFLEQLARKTLGRGRFDLSVRSIGATFKPPQLARERALGMYRALATLRDEIAPGADIPFSSLLSLPGAFESASSDTEGVQAALDRAFTQARVELDAMRKLEGDALTTEMTGRLDVARQLRRDIEGSSVDLLTHHAIRLRERVEKLLKESGAQLNADRLEHEIALLADKSDITEELVRLDSHFEQMAALFAADEPVGRKLDFLLQEVGREVNTIGSKSQHAPVAHLVISLKTEVERLREQVQNVD